jgi:hypothetical protein
VRSINDMPPSEKYPNARNAVAYFETVVLPNLTPAERAFCRTRSVDVLVSACHDGVRGVLASCGTAGPLLQRAAPEFDTEDFRKYLMAVIFGAM